MLAEDAYTDSSEFAATAAWVIRQIDAQAARDWGL